MGEGDKSAFFEGCLFSAITTLCECHAGCKQDLRWGLQVGFTFVLWFKFKSKSTSTTLSLPGISF